MPRTYRPALMALFAMLAFFVLGTSAQGPKYCSPFNTASDDVYTWPWQSNGNCTNHCAEQGNYAFAVIKFRDCYCSDYVPSPQVSLSDCAVGCPGFPNENCGNKDKGTFIYLELLGKPSGTKSAEPAPEPTSSEVVSSKAPPKPTPQPTSQAPEPQMSEVVVTEGGSTIIKTIFISQSPSPTSSTAPVKTENENNGPDVGAVAGGVAGGIIGLLAIIGGILFILYRRRKQRRAAEEDGTDGGPHGITRNTSTMSKAGLLGRTTEIEQPYQPQVTTTFGTQNSRYGGDNQSVSPISNRRNSQPLVIDSRMNPQAMIEYAGANASRESLGTIDDSRDYGRKLDVRNPDP